MFVTSDIFDLQAIGRWRGFDWRENLVAGVEVHGASWRGYEAGAAFLLEATRRCGLLSEMKWAGYNRPGDRRTNNIKPASFARLAQGALSGAKTADSVLFRGDVSAPGSRLGEVLVGGQAGATPPRVPLAYEPTARRYHPFSADFIFPALATSEAKAAELLRLAVEMLDAEYGYYFVRDDLCGPWVYAAGIGTPLDYSDLNYEDDKEIWRWRQYVKSGRLWSAEYPLLRDLYQINLISERHKIVETAGLSRLIDWIEARSDRGRLDELGRGRWLWALTDEEIFNVRPLLNQAGLLKSCRDRVYRDLHPGTGVKPYAAPRCYTAARVR
jgi:hypothetical protein